MERIVSTKPGATIIISIIRCLNMYQMKLYTHIPFPLPPPLQLLLFHSPPEGVNKICKLGGRGRACCGRGRGVQE